MITDYDADQINHRATLARAWLADDPDVDVDKGVDALRALADEDVPALLCALQELTVRNDTGYVRGLRAAVRWLAAFDQDLPGFDRATCQQLATGMRAMAHHAEQRTGVEAGPPIVEAVEAFLTGAHWAGWAALHEVKEFGDARRALNEVICGLDRVAQGLAVTGKAPDRPLLPADQVTR